ncbi:Hypothetical predicted protein, partial [Marmota monax]
RPSDDTEGEGKSQLCPLLLRIHPGTSWRSAFSPLRDTGAADADSACTVKS